MFSLPLFFIPVIAMGLLSDPMLQNPTADSISVVWFTESPKGSHYVEYGADLLQKAPCQTTKLSRMREDKSDGSACEERPIYRHEALLQGLPPSKRTPYRAVSALSESEIVKSETYSCAPMPAPGTPLKILLTSDHQVKPMVAANLQKVKKTIPQIDAIFFAGDAVDHADKASEWFDDPSGGSFFPCLQGRAHRTLGGAVYRGAPLLQFAPMFCAIGNHEVMGRWNMDKSLDAQFGDAYPKEALQKGSIPQCVEWMKDHTFNTDSYEEIFTLPNYYATTVGDVRLVVLYATRIWRSAKLDGKGKYTEHPESFEKPLDWGYGDFIFEPIEKGSTQYQWLEAEMQSADFQRAKYKIVMLHNPLHSLGENSIPPYTPPIQTIERDLEGKIASIRYHYPRGEDLLVRDVEPLLEQYGVQLVLCGHTHVWNRFQSEAGVHHLETSNVGNSYGAYLRSGKRPLLPGGNEDGDYIGLGDPNGLIPIVPTLAPLKDECGEPLPYISSNEITVFSVFSTDTGAVDSYYFDTVKPESEVVHFDRFYLGQKEGALVPTLSIAAVKEHAQIHGLPDLVIFDVDNTLIESERQIALDPSINGYLRKRFPDNSEEIIRAVQAVVPWTLCEPMTAEVVRFFQESGVQVIAVTKKSPEIKEQVALQLKANGIDLETGREPLTIKENLYYKGVLYAYSDKGTALKGLLEHLQWDWKDRTIYCVDDRKSHLQDLQKQFGSEAKLKAFEYTHTHKKRIDESIVERQLNDFLSGKDVREDTYYADEKIQTEISPL